MAQGDDTTRGGFGTRLGFVLAAAGSAIGLGNVWRFPYMAGQSGGGAFVIVYLVFIALIGVPVLLSELAVGRASQRNPVGAFSALAPKSAWPLVGGLGVLTGFVILSYYSVVAGWTLGYIYEVLTGAFAGGLSAEESGELYSGLVSNPAWAIGLTALFMLLAIGVVRGGVHGGIERAAKVLMPLFFLLLLVLALRSVTLPGAGGGVAFLFEFDFAKLADPGVIVAALGQALFSLSLGMGAMITYGSYLSRSENLAVSGLTVAGFDTLIALLSGFMIFPALFAAGVDPKAGPELVFVVVPTILDDLPVGTAFGLAFYVLLGVAALTSAISLLEVVVAYFVDERGWKRERAVWTVGGAAFLAGVPSALSGSILGNLDFTFGNLSLGVGALFVCLFVGWRWGVPGALGEIEHGGRLPFASVWGVLVQVVCPLAVAIVLVSKLL